jgi:cytochrome c biogenesis protein CcdA
MSAEGIIKNLRVLWRADRIIAEIQLRRMLVGLMAKGFAALFAAFGILMLELAAYFALVQVWTAIVAAVALGVFNLLLAGLILLIASRKGRESAEYEVAMALHNSAIETLQLQARSFETARSSTYGFETIVPSLVVPAIGLLVKSLRQRKAAAGQ